MKSWQRTVLIGVAEIAGFLLLHQVLLAYLARHDVVSSIFAAGPHVSRDILLLAGAFLLIRLFAVFFLPGMILGRIGLTIWAARQPSSMGENGNNGNYGG